MEVWSDEISDWDTTPADKCVSQPPLFCARFSKLIDMDTHMVIAVNMYDELEKKGDRFDYVSLARMIGVPIIPTIGKTGFGIDSLLKKIIEVYEAKNR